MNNAKCPKCGREHDLDLSEVACPCGAALETNGEYIEGEWTAYWEPVNFPNETAQRQLPEEKR